VSNGLSVILGFCTGDVCAMTEIAAMCVTATIRLSVASADVDFTSERKQKCMVRIFRALARSGNCDYDRTQAWNVFSQSCC